MSQDIESKINGLLVDYKCSKCGEQKKVPIFPYIDFNDNPQYYKIVKNLDIFKVSCQKCGNIQHIRFDSLIVNPKLKYYIYLFTNNDVSIFRKNVDYFVKNVLNVSDIKQWKQIKTRLVTDLNQLIQKMTIFQLGLNDKIIQIIKAGLIDKKIIEAANNQILFDGIEKTNLQFLYYKDNKLDQVIVNISFYNNLIQCSKKITEDDENFALIDHSWVTKNVLI